MESSGTETALTDGLEQPASTGATSRRRWADLGLVLLIGFAPLVVGSIYQLFFPTVTKAFTTNFRFVLGLVQETGVVVLCFTLLRRQGRSLKEIGFGWQWLDLPKAVWLWLVSYIALILVSTTIQYVHFFWTGTSLQVRDAKTIFAGASPLLLLIYMVAAPVFEETLVRGYLMTELIGLSWPVWLAAAASVVLQGSYHLYYGVAGALMVSAGFTVSASTSPFHEDCS